MDSHPPLRWSTAGYFGIMAMFLALGSGTEWAAPAAHTAPRQAYDPDRKILFSADPASPDIHVLTLYHNVASLADLHAPERHVIHDMRLTAEKQSLWVLADSGIYRYDTRMLKLTYFHPGKFSRADHFAKVSEHDCTLRELPVQTRRKVS